MYPIQIRKQAEALRKAGKTYGEIRTILGISISKSALSDWCNAIELSGMEQARLDAKKLKNEERGRLIAHAILRKRRQEYLESVRQRTVHLPGLLKDKNVAKIALGMLYLGEGFKRQTGGHVGFGNSDPDIIRLFLRLLRQCYAIDEKKFRCTVQCRADQDTVTLEKFWTETTAIPKSQFYPARFDPRTIGKVSVKKDYKGVCKIEYLSADLYYELINIGKISCKGP